MKNATLVVAGIVLLVGMIVGLVSWGFSFREVKEQEAALSADLERRTQLSADSLKESVEPYLSQSTSSLQAILDRFTGSARLAGIAVYNVDAQPVAVTKLEPSTVASETAFVAQAMDSGTAAGRYVKPDEGEKMYLLAMPLERQDQVAGGMMVAQNAGYIDTAIGAMWRRNAQRLAIQVLFSMLALGLVFRWLMVQPLLRITQAVRALRSGLAGADSLRENPLFRPLANEITKLNKSLHAARSAARQEARLRHEKLETPWTEDRLKEFVKAYLKDRPIFAVSNREPYSHERVRNRVEYSVPASGLVTAIEPLMEACGGTWVAHGSGSADRDTVDKDDKVPVPPEEPKYSLKRIWLAPEEVKGYYLGYSNEALWPLCHMAHTRPTFRNEDWTEYRRANGKFAQSLLAEIANVSNPIILIQDYHLALLPRMIKASRPDAHIGIFWHIPWPSAESFSICPQRKEILRGMLGADVIGFHIQDYCNNFMDTVAKEIEALNDAAQFTITHEGHPTRIRAFPISIAFSDTSAPDEPPARDILAKLGVKTKHVGLGVDRMDYTKGIPERLRGVEFFLDAHPEYRGEFTFLQIAPPSREGVEKYREYNATVTREAERINEKFRTRDWQPIVLEKKHYNHEALSKLYRLADLCLVTPLHDGMNLVAKEFVAARNDEAGVLILSRFAGAARDLQGALSINPYSAENTADAIHAALTMSKLEQRRRMKAMREEVANYNVYRWSAEFLKAVTRLS